MYHQTNAGTTRPSNPQLATEPAKGERGYKKPETDMPNAFQCSLFPSLPSSHSNPLLTPLLPPTHPPLAPSCPLLAPILAPSCPPSFPPVTRGLPAQSWPRQMRTLGPGPRLSCSPWPPPPTAPWQPGTPEEQNICMKCTNSTIHSVQGTVHFIHSLTHLIQSTIHCTHRIADFAHSMKWM